MKELLGNTEDMTLEEVDEMKSMATIRLSPQQIKLTIFCLSLIFRSSRHAPVPTLNCPDCLGVCRGGS